MEPRHSLPKRHSDNETRNWIEICRFFTLLGIALFFASFPQAEEFFAALCLFLLVSAVICCMAAIIGKERLSPHHLTRWDVAATLLGLSLFSKMASA